MKNSSSMKLVCCCFFLGIHLIVSGQSFDVELRSKLTSADRNRLEKADKQFKEGDKIKEEARKMVQMNSTATGKDQFKLQKKYSSKRLDADSYYAKSNKIKVTVYHAAIKKFWRTYQGDKFPLKFIQSIGSMANDSLTKAADLRYNAGKTKNAEIKLGYILKAERIENKFVSVMGKVLFSYLNYPVAYDHEWIVSPGSTLPEKILEEKKSSPLTVINSQSDSLRQEKAPGILDQPVRKVPPHNKDTLQILAKNSAQHQDSVVHRTETKRVSPVPVKETRVENIKNPVHRKSEKIHYEANDSSLYGRVAVDEDQVDLFNSFLKTKYPKDYQHYIIDFQKLDYSDIVAIRQAWYNYIFANYPEDTGKLVVLQKTRSVSSFSTVYKRALPEERVNSMTDSTKPAGEDTAYKMKRIRGPEVVNLISTPSPKVVPEDTATQPADSGIFVFRVQIAACRVHLNRKILKGIYNGPEKIVETHEDHWYKYAVCAYATYHSARKLRDKIRIPGAFVIAYLNGKRIKITPAIAYKKSPYQFKPGMDPDLITFRVQIAASRVRLAQNIIDNIYKGSILVDMLKENGWCKYSLPCGNNYLGAVGLLRKIKVPGAFIAAYYNFKKMDLDYAKRLIRE